MWRSIALKSDISSMNNFLDHVPLRVRMIPPVRWIGSAAILLVAALAGLSGCGPSEARPVELFPEDMCALCRMAISDHRFASEIISESGEVFKFDDIGCLEAYRSGHEDVKISALFVMDYEQKAWLRWESAVIVETDIFTPMASGKVAFADSARAMEFKRLHPAEGEDR